MFRSLRFRLPALFLAGAALSGLVSAVLSVGLFQDYTEDRLVAEMRREARGLTILYAEQAERAIGRPETTVQRLSRATRRFEQASGSQLYYAGARFFFGSGRSGLRTLPHDIVQWRDGRIRTFEFTPPGAKREYLAVSSPLRLGGRPPYLGTLIVAKPTAELRERWLTLIERLALAGLVGIAVAGALAWYLTRRITKPVEALAEAANEIAEGHYHVDLPQMAANDEIGNLAARFGEMATRLEEAEELERNFLMTVSHELRTPLTAIRGHVEALREGVADDPALRAASLVVIAAEAVRLERLVGDILDLAKLESNRFTVVREEVDMDSLCERAFTTFGDEARRRAIDYRLEANARPVIVTDGDRVLQIITNLLSNAFRWTPDGGRIELDLSAENGTVAVVVGDTGPGIAPDEQDRIFRPFWSRDGSGTGLGLAIAHELATALGGSISVETAPGKGSRFELQLPGTTSS